MPKNLPLDAARLWRDIMELSEITEPDRPYTRRSFSARFLEGRMWLDRRFAEAGLTTRLDAAGNLIGRLDGRDPGLGTIAVGSHSDTVPSGGRFDGIAGVVAGLEIARALRDSGSRLDHSFEVVDFLAEEPSEYGLSCIGSRGMTGSLDERMLSLASPDGETVHEAIKRIGGAPDRIHDARRRDIQAFLELHIEQGAVLESEKIEIGVVTSIVGIRRLEIEFEGRADHAGTTPLGLRRDALIAAAEMVGAVRALAKELDDDGDGYFVATVGILDVKPSASNVVPGACRLVIDLRSTDAALISRFSDEIDRRSEAAASAARVKRRAFLTLSDGPPVACDPMLQASLRDASDRLDLSRMELPSGAGHDAAFMSRICRSAMLFVPSRGGLSHSPEEWTDQESIALGASVLFEAVRALDISLRSVVREGVHTPD